ncbi:MAG: HlyD family secretion protein, partial [Pseudomonadota bacterium]
APIDGVVSGADLDTLPASFVGLGTPLVEIVDPAALYVVTEVSPRTRARLGTESGAVFRADARPGAPVEITLGRPAVAPDGEPPAVSYRADSPPLPAEAAAGLAPGMQGVTRVSFGRTPLALLVWRRVRDWALLTFWL